MAKTDWEKYIDYVDQMPEPTCDTMSANMTEQGSHGGGKSYHYLTRYDIDLEAPKPYRLVFSWANCAKCRSVRWRKVVAYYNQENACFEKIYYKLTD